MFFFLMVFSPAFLGKRWYCSLTAPFIVPQSPTSRTLCERWMVPCHRLLLILFIDEQYPLRTVHYKQWVSFFPTHFFLLCFFPSYHFFYRIYIYYIYKGARDLSLHNHPRHGPCVNDEWCREWTVPGEQCHHCRINFFPLINIFSLFRLFSCSIF
jgi:hypothetical protein